MVKRLFAIAFGAALLMATGCDSPKPVQTPQVVKPPTTKLSDSFAKAALLALIKIRSDSSLPVERDGQQYGSKFTVDTINEANANAVTEDEKAITNTLVKLYSDKLKQNHYNDIILTRTHLTDTQIKAVVNAEIAIGENDDPCIKALDSSLRARDPKMPAPCRVPM